MARPAEAACLADSLGGGFQPEPESSYKGEPVPRSPQGRSGIALLQVYREKGRSSFGDLPLKELEGYGSQSPKRRVPRTDPVSFFSRSRKNTQNAVRVPYAGRSLR